MKIRLWLLLSLLLVISLAACKSAAPSPSTTQAAPVQQETSPEPSVYPAPAVFATSAPPGSGGALYPPPQANDGDKVSWDWAVAMIKNKEVSQVTQSHSLEVTLHLKDGRTLLTAEPTIDDVLTVIKDCGDPCKDITVATE